jgi:hypothetical protein
VGSHDAGHGEGIVYRGRDDETVGDRAPHERRMEGPGIDEIGDI